MPRKEDRAFHRKNKLHCRNTHTRNMEGASWSDSAKLVFRAMLSISNLKPWWAIMTPAAHLTPGRQSWSFRPQFHQLPESNKEPQPSHLADALRQENEKPTPGEGETDSERVFWTFSEYTERSRESCSSPLGKELSQLFICFDSQVLHRIMCKMGAT